MERYPYEATIVKKEEVTKLRPHRVPRYEFLDELKEQLQPHQAIQLVVEGRQKREAITSAWRRQCKGLDPHTYSRKRDDKDYTIYLWLGPLEEETS